MQVHDILRDRKTEILKEIERLQTELIEIDNMLAVASVAGVGASQSQRHVPTGAVPATKDEAILKAIGAGAKTPAAISQFIRDRLGMTVNDASTRTRLSRMKSADKIAHDGNGWKLKDAE